MPHKAIHTPLAPAAIGPYSQAVLVSPQRAERGRWVFCSGQIALSPGTGELVAGGVEPETRQVMANLEQVLAAAGATFTDVVKTTIYLIDLADFSAVNAIYGEAFGGVPPARATVQVARLPKGACVEIDAIAYIGADG